MSNYRVIISYICSSGNIQPGSKFICATCFTVMRPTSQHKFVARARTPTSLSSFLISLFVPFFRDFVCPCQIGSFALTLTLCISLITFHSFHTNLITKTPKFVPSKAKQIKTKRFHRQMTWMEKVTMKVLISFQNNLRSERANIWQWMSIFSKRDIWLFGYFSLSPSIIYMVYYTILLDFDRTDSINKHTLTTRIPVFSPFFALSSNSISIPIAISIAVRFNALYRCSY